MNGNQLRLSETSPHHKREVNRHKPVLVVMARWPAAGRCKNRLAAEIGPEQASLIQRRLTEHTFQVAQKIANKGLLELQIAFSGITPQSAAKQLGIYEGINSLLSQGQGSLGLRMRRQVLRVQRAHSPNKHFERSTLLIGTDLPDLCEKDLLIALEALKKKEMVIGPASDGGYWLLGLSRGLVKPVASWPFCGIPWGTNQVLQKTLQKATKAKVQYELLNQKNDLDRLEDLNQWQLW